MRRLQIWQFLVVVVLYLVVVQGATYLLTADSDDTHGQITSTDYLLRNVVVPVGLGAALAVAVAAWLGRWDELFTSRPRLPRITLAYPAVLLVLLLVITHYGGLAARGLEFTLLLLVGTLMVGFAEELVFRGLGVTAFRDSGRGEVSVAAWTSLVFGAAHGSNILFAGPSALLQALLTVATGLVFYVVLRSTGSLVAAMAAHGLWDFGVLSSQVDPDQPWPLVNASAVVLGLLVLSIVVFRRRLTGPREAVPTR